MRVLSNEHSATWEADRLHILYVFLGDCMVVLRAQSKDLRRTVNTSTAMVRRKATFKENVRSLMSYAQALEEHYFLALSTPA